MLLPERWEHRTFPGVAARILCLTAALAWSQGPAIYNRNLIGNGDAEAGATGANVPSWKGYGGFTVSKSGVPKLVEYIQQQKEHHRRTSFVDEFMQILRAHSEDAGVDDVFRNG